MTGQGSDDAQIAIESELFEALGRFIDHRDEPPRGRMSANDAVNVIVRDWLMSQGYLPLPTEQDGVVKALDAARVP